MIDAYTGVTSIFDALDVDVDVVAFADIGADVATDTTNGGVATVAVAFAFAVVSTYTFVAAVDFAFTAACAAIVDDAFGIAFVVVAHGDAIDGIYNF